MSSDFYYKDKVTKYFTHKRTEIEQLLPKYSEKVLEIGCGTGETLRWLQDIGKIGVSFGCEISNEALVIAEQNIDNILSADVERDEIYHNESFDLILALDVLEHLVDPWSVLKKIVKNNMQNGSTLIASIPNVRHYSVLKQLLLNKDWHYEESGILDKTHLRFFTKSTSISMIESSGLSVKKIIGNPSGVTAKQKLFNKLTLNIFYDFVSQQYIFSAIKDKKFDEN
jgi:2-polyprenyl-3-methyl-5-hydroxy-6-metoxy-1,4-benzoquinol methylase